MTKANKAVDLVQVIKDNPGCWAQVDNDWWGLYRIDPDENPHEDDDQADNWDEKNLLASSSDAFVPHLGDDGYGSGNCYGGDILQALAVIVGIKVGSV